MSDAAAASHDRDQFVGKRRCGGGPWQLSPSITRASASREKLQPPEVAAKPVPVAPVETVPPSIEIKGRVLAKFGDYDGMHSAVRKRAADLSLTREDLDHLSGLQAGYSAKILSPTQIKAMGRISLGSTLGALGCYLVLVEDPGLTAKMLDRVQKRKRGSHGARGC